MLPGYCRYCGHPLVWLGFIAGASGAKAVFILICQVCDGHAADDRGNR